MEQKGGRGRGAGGWWGRGRQVQGEKRGALGVSRERSQLHVFWPCSLISMFQTITSWSSCRSTLLWSSIPHGRQENGPLRNATCCCRQNLVRKRVGRFEPMSVWPRRFSFDLYLAEAAWEPGVRPLTTPYERSHTRFSRGPWNRKCLSLADAHETVLLFGRSVRYAIHKAGQGNLSADQMIAGLISVLCTQSCLSVHYRDTKPQIAPKRSTMCEQLWWILSDGTMKHFSEESDETWKGK